MVARHSRRAYGWPRRFQTPAQPKPATTRHGTLSRPVAVILMAILQHIDDEHDPYAIVAALMGALPTGSYLALSHPASDIDAEAMAKMADVLNKMMAEKVTFRDRAAVSGFFAGLELVEPGLVQASKWRPASGVEAASPAALWAGVARKE